MIHAAARDQWTRLRAELAPFVARRVAQSDVDDVLQEVFVRVHRGVGELRDEQRFGPWVYQVARSTVIDHLRRRARGPEVRDELPEVSAECVDDGGPLTEAEARMAPFVALFVEALPSPYREALTYTELEGLSQRAAAARAGVSLTAMKSRVQRGRERVRAMYESVCVIERDARGRVLACTPRRGDCCAPRGCAEG